MKNLDRDAMYRDYLAGASLRDLAEKYHYTLPNIWGLFRRHHLPMRSKLEGQRLWQTRRKEGAR